MEELFQTLTKFTNSEGSTLFYVECGPAVKAF